MNQFQRKIKLQISNGEQVFDLSEFRVQFEVHQRRSSTPTNAKITIYNLSENTLHNITAETADTPAHWVELSVGYDEPQRLFYGAIVQFNAGRDASPTTYLTITAVDGYYAFRNATINTTLPAGWTHQDEHAAIVAGFEAAGAGRGHTSGIPNTPMPRGKAIYDSGREAMDKLIHNNTNASWRPRHNRIEVLAAGDTPDGGGEAIVLNSRTGLIGLPQLMIDGVELKALINPQFVMGAYVKLNNADIQLPDLPVDYENARLRYPGINRDGLYWIVLAEHRGDTRGNEWYSQLTCLGVGATGANSATLQNSLPKIGESAVHA